MVQNQSLEDFGVLEIKSDSWRNHAGHVRTNFTVIPFLTFPDVMEKCGDEK